MRRLTLGVLFGTALAALARARRAGRLAPAGAASRIGDGLQRINPLGRDDEDLAALTKDELYSRAQAEDIPGRSEMSKDELVKALRAKRRGSNS